MHVLESRLLGRDREKWIHLKQNCKDRVGPGSTNRQGQWQSIFWDLVGKTHMGGTPQGEVFTEGFKGLIGPLRQLTLFL
jgi:hypothetical protein